MSDVDAFTANIEGVTQLVQSGLNKTDISTNKDGVNGEPENLLTLKLTDEELLRLSTQWENNNAPYDRTIDEKSKRNKMYYLGLQNSGTSQANIPGSSNLLFEGTETFIPQAIAKNPEPVVFSDNTPEGKKASNDLKCMLQYHATVLNFKRKLGQIVRQWGIYYTGIVKYGWNMNVGTKGDIEVKLRKPQNFILDKDGYIDEFGRFHGYLGEKIESTADELIKLFPEHKEYITIRVLGHLGTSVIRTEWWTDEYCFTRFEDKILDKHKNEFWNYDEKTNHLPEPMMPYTFFSVFSLQEQPHDMTNLIEQNISNQNRITKRDYQIDKNLDTNNNSIAVSDNSFNAETAHLAAKALQDGDPILVSGNIDQAIRRIPANPLPAGILQAQQTAKDTLRGSMGVQGVLAQAPTDNTTAHGMVLNQEYDSTRISGGVGNAIEAFATSMFNWCTQLYYVFYDEPHYAAVMGNGQAVEMVELQMADEKRQFVVTVAPNSMAPKDELAERQNAINLATEGLLDPITLFQDLDDADPLQTAKKVVLWKISPQSYLQTYFPEQAQQVSGTPPPQGGQAIGTGGSPPPKDLLGQEAPLPKI